MFKKKAQNLHNEGVAQAAWALARAEIWDAEAWEIIKREALERDFDFKVVKNAHWTLTSYTDVTTSEHLMQSGLSEYAQQYFFQDKAALFDLHDGLTRAHAKNPNLGLDKILVEFERKYPKTRQHSETYAKLVAEADVF